VSLYVLYPQKKLILVGSCKTLSKVPLLKLLVEKVEEQSGIINVSKTDINYEEHKGELKRCSHIRWLLLSVHQNGKRKEKRVTAWIGFFPPSHYAKDLAFGAVKIVQVMRSLTFCSIRKYANRRKKNVKMASSWTKLL